ncbi:tumor protein p53-inducible nuclear protein 2 isoform X2 [Gouania willdenowi]|uniref:Tumor protein p53-inducible nuclear protein 2-like n=1 Tax=Gouania willdenowi TaxID=441366 RepID=A0A8C5GYW5_GOUWI|nr:tumor protein p53-inducible nuclear protein 2-like isoform X2 [Gouania willdenowi]
MFGKIFSHFLGNTDEDLEATDDARENHLELEDEGWIIVNLPDGDVSSPCVDALENLLIEHPSMSVYQRSYRMSGEEKEDEEGSDEEDDPRPVVVRQHVSWRLAAWGLPLPCGLQLQAAERARTQAERKKLGRGFLHRQNLTHMRSSLKEKSYGYFKQPCQRTHNY